jgi:hypothetical protein
MTASMARDLACPGCPAEIRLTEGARLLRARVIHQATCAWFRQYQIDRIPRCVPCGTVVTHRGPYQRDRALGSPA